MTRGEFSDVLEFASDFITWNFKKFPKMPTFIIENLHIFCQFSVEQLNFL